MSKSSKPNSQIIIYQTESGQTKIEVRLQDETVWLTQKLMAELFQTTKQNISLYIKNIFEEGELVDNSVVKDFLTTAADGKNRFLCATGGINSIPFCSLTSIHTGTISHELAAAKAEDEYEIYNQKHITAKDKTDNYFDKAVKNLEIRK